MDGYTDKVEVTFVDRYQLILQLNPHDCINAKCATSHTTTSITRPSISSSSPHLALLPQNPDDRNKPPYIVPRPHRSPSSSHAQRSQVHSLIRNVHAELIFRAKTRHDGLDGVRDGQIDAVLSDEESLCRFREVVFGRRASS